MITANFKNKADIVIETRRILGKEKLEVLEALFAAATGSPPLVTAGRYRADHIKWMPMLDQLSHADQLIRFDSSGLSYRITCFVLPLLESQKAIELVKIMDSIYDWFKIAYKEHLSELIKIDDLLLAINEDTDKVRLALFYMQEAHDTWSSRGTDFPYGENQHFSISESVLQRDSFSDVLLDYYRWHYINPKSRVMTLGNYLSAKTHDTYGFFNKSDTRQFPEWYDELSDTDKTMISEIDKALQANLTALPVMGIRALIENTIIKIIGDKGTFTQNLDAFCDAGYLTKQNRNVLDNVINAGHAAIHRSHIPSEEDTKICLEIVKHMMQGVYILKPKSDLLKSRTPEKKSSKANKDL